MRPGSGLAQRADWAPKGVPPSPLPGSKANILDMVPKVIIIKICNLQNNIEEQKAKQRIQNPTFFVTFQPKNVEIQKKNRIFRTFFVMGFRRFDDKS